MFEISVEREFCAAHAIMIDGEREPVHGHNWRVRVVIEGQTLDRNGLLVDFHDLERRIDRIIAPMDNADLNARPAFEQRNPTAEHVAQHIGESIAADLPERVRLLRVTISEAPGCRATWRPG